MFNFIMRRLLQAIPTVFGITILSFLIMTAAPGGPTSTLSIDPRLSVEAKAAAAARLGVDQPWHMQYLYWLIGDDWVQRDTDGDGESDMWGRRQGILRGDWGISFTRGQRGVLDLISEFVIPTLELTVVSLLIGMSIGLPVGILSATWRGGKFDNVSRVMAVLFSAIPNFWLGLVLILLFGSLLGWLPMSGRCPVPSAQQMISGNLGCPPIYARLEFLIMPTITLGTVYMAGYSRYMRASMLDVINQDYMRTAHAKGLTQRRVWFTHGARNALMPIATFIGPTITGLLGGAVITETIFSWPGLGRLSIQAVREYDYPIVMGVVLIGAIATILGYILSDILYAVIDPRVRLH
jgi:peptide/nickel transport system permease protein